MIVQMEKPKPILDVDEGLMRMDWVLQQAREKKAHQLFNDGVAENPAWVDDQSFYSSCYEAAELTSKEKMDVAMQVVMALPIKGCVTGSYWLPTFDPDAWGSKPDIDVFCYGEDQLTKAITLAQYALCMTPGKGSERSTRQEEWKIDRYYKSGLNHRIGITTYTFECEGIMLNFTLKEKKVRGRWYPLTTPADVLSSFDMSIVMQGYDIETAVFWDLRVGDPMVAVPNPLRDHDCTIWTVSKWVRQFERVVKYYNRGYDTRPMAKFYLEMIDKCIEEGCLFDSDESQEMFDQFAGEFKEKREAIEEWYKEHLDD